VRVLLYLRFAVYAAILAGGIAFLIHRDDSEAATPRPPGPILQGRTDQGRQVSVGLADGAVHTVDLDVSMTCRYGSVGPLRLGFVDAFKGDFHRQGSHFTDTWSDARAAPDGSDLRIDAGLQGKLTDDGHSAAGTVSFMAHRLDGGRETNTCWSGLLRFAAKRDG
jgi:hypothetical protein